ncbi:MAG: YceI family protein [Pseudoxanthomonas sp.]|nr:YceI family protein [Pseudoxanthomonas sp.]
MWKSEGYARLLCAALFIAATPGRAQAPVPAPPTAVTPAPVTVAFDTAGSWLGFEVRTRFGQRMAGEFPRYEGLVEYLPDGRHRVRLRVATTEAVIPDRPRYTAWMRSQSFFDAIRHPWMVFVSEPYSPELLRDGGPLKGRLDLRGVARDEELTVAPATCARPGLDCDIQVVGLIERANYGMRDWQFALADDVRLEVRVRLREAAP